MKQTLCLGLIAVCIFLSPACKKNNGSGSSTNTNGNNFSDSIKSLVPQPIIDSLRSWGMNIHDGQTPPSIAGIYVDSPNVCTFDNSVDHEAGRRFEDYKFRFSAQDNATSTIQADRKSIDGSQFDAATDSVATFISGSGNFFTIFAEEKGVGSGVSYTSLELFSGQITTAGIAYFQNGYYMKAKGPDPGNLLVPVGTSRIFIDADSLAVTSATYSLSPAPRTGDIRTLNAMGSLLTDGWKRRDGE